MSACPTSSFVFLSMAPIILVVFFFFPLHKPKKKKKIVKRKSFIMPASSKNTTLRSQETKVNPATALVDDPEVQPVQKKLGRMRSISASSKHQPVIDQRSFSTATPVHAATFDTLQALHRDVSSEGSLLTVSLDSRSLTQHSLARLQSDPNLSAFMSTVVIPQSQKDSDEISIISITVPDIHSAVEEPEQISLEDVTREKIV